MRTLLGSQVYCASLKIIILALNHSVTCPMVKPLLLLFIFIITPKLQKYLFSHVSASIFTYNSFLKPTPFLYPMPFSLLFYYDSCYAHLRIHTP